MFPLSASVQISHILDIGQMGRSPNKKKLDRSSSFFLQLTTLNGICALDTILVKKDNSFSILFLKSQGNYKGTLKLGGASKIVFILFFQTAYI